MKRAVIGVVVVFFLMGLFSVSPSAEAAFDWRDWAPAWAGGYKTPKMTCGQLMGRQDVPRSTEQRLVDLQSEYYRRHLGAMSLPDEMLNIEVIANVGDRFIVRQSDGLKLVSAKGLNATDFDIVPLQGSELATKPYVEKGKFIIPTFTRAGSKEEAEEQGGQRTNYLNVVTGLKNQGFSSAAKNYERLSTTLDRGIITVFGNQLILNVDERETATKSFDGNIKKAKMVHVEGMPVLEVRYTVVGYKENVEHTAYLYVEDLELKVLAKFSSKDKLRKYKLNKDLILFAINRDHGDHKSFEIRIFSKDGDNLASKEILEDIDPNAFERIATQETISFFSIGGKLGIKGLGGSNVIAIENSSDRHGSNASVMVHKDAIIKHTDKDITVIQKKKKSENGEDVFYEYTMYQNNGYKVPRVALAAFQTPNNQFEEVALPHKELKAIKGLVAYKVKDSQGKEKTILYSKESGQTVMFSSIEQVLVRKGKQSKHFLISAKTDGKSGFFVMDLDGKISKTMDDKEMVATRNDSGVDEPIYRGVFSSGRSIQIPTDFGLEIEPNSFEMKLNPENGVYEISFKNSDKEKPYDRALVLINFISPEDAKCLEDEQSEEERTAKTCEVKMSETTLFDPYKVENVEGYKGGLYFGSQVAGRKQAVMNSQVAVINDGGIQTYDISGQVTGVKLQREVFRSKNVPNLLNFSVVPFEGSGDKFQNSTVLLPVGRLHFGETKQFYNTFSYETEGATQGYVAFGAEQRGNYNPAFEGISYAVIVNASGIHEQKVPGKVTTMRIYDNYYSRGSGKLLVEIDSVPNHRSNLFRHSRMVGIFTSSGFTDFTTMYNPMAINAKGFEENERVYAAEQVQNFDGDLSNQTYVHVVSPNGSVSQVLTGTVKELEKDERFVHGQAAMSLGVSDVSVMSRMDSENLERHFELINEFTAYEDEEVKIHATRRMNNQFPELLYYEKERPGIVHKINLEFKLDDEDKEERGGGFAAFLRMVFGMEEEEDTSNINKNDIQSIEREDDLLFIKTIPEKGSVAKTYVYSLSKQKLMFMVPNMDRHVDIGDYRFYIGQPSQFNRSIVSIFNRKTHAYVKHFDFGRVRLNMDKPPEIDGNRIRFFTANGSSRVYNEETGSFDGFLPGDIKDMVEPVADKIGEIMNLTMFDTDHAPIIGRDNVVAKMEEHLPMTTEETGGSRAVFLKGHDGSGRTVITEEFVARYLQGELDPTPDVNAVFIRVNGLTLKSNRKYVGEYETKFNDLMKLGENLRDRGYRLVVVLDDVHKIRDKYEGDDTFGYLRALVKSKMVDVIATSSQDGASRLAKSQSDFVNSMTPVDIPVKSDEEIYNDLSTYMVRNYPDEAQFDEVTLRYLIERLTRLSNTRGMPGAGYELVDHVVKTVYDKCEPGQECVITRKDVNESLSAISGIPAMLLDPDREPEVYGKILTHLQAHVHGQDEATEELAGAFSGFSYSYISPDKPIGVYLLPGPTGVGKTETVVSLAKVLFNGTDQLLKISGEDYPVGCSAEKIQEAKRLIVNHLKQYPFNITLFDEVEKMDERIRQLLLSLADGFVTDENGKKVNSNNSIIFATSNVGMSEVVKRETALRDKRLLEIAREMGVESDEELAQITLDITDDLMLSDAEIADITSRHIVGFFKPEQRGRLRIIQYNRLKELVMRGILNQYLTSDEYESVAGRLERDYIDLDYTEEAIEYMVANFFDIELGARKLKDNVERYLVNDFIVKMRRQRVIEKGESSTNKNQYTVHYDKKSKSFVIIK